jgi:hypothetical protein
MERKWIALLILSFLFPLTAQAEHEGYDDQVWADIGSEFSVEESDLSQKRSLSDINDSEGLLSMGVFIKLSQDVNLRETPGGEKIKPILKGKVYQILGVHVKKSGRRYYKVKDDEDVGYFYAGTKQDYKKWARQIWSDSGAEKVVALPGDSIKVKRRSGMRIFKGPEFKKELTHVSKNKKLTVKDIIEGQDGQVIYFVKYRDKTGYIKAGDTQNIAFSKQWNEIN